MSDANADTLLGQPSPGGPERPSKTDLALGARLGRYLILDVLGRGGMGVVYAAYDPVLDRKIAVKLLTEADFADEPASDGTSHGRLRMQREAQALARLSHPNVITVHDVAEHAGGMYIAMEMVDGGTLREWRSTRPWREVLEGYLAAARGLAAAHAAGLVHRDFKPENVLVGGDGRIRVTDFGLARLSDDPSPPDRPSLSPNASAFSSPLTIAGAVMGTPNYMAPEQIDGGVVDARSDQFAWCVAAWEALYNVPPFPGGNLALRSAAIKADPVVVPARSAIPRNVGRALARGLAAEAGERWPDVLALIAALERAARPRRAPVVAVGAVGIAAAVVLVLVLGRSVGAGPDCGTAGDAIDATWSADARGRLDRGFAATGASFAGDASAALDRSVDGWRDRWKRTAIDSCRATRETGAQSEAMLDLRAACLTRRRGELANLVAALAQPSRAAVEDAAALHLPDLDTCDDAAQLAGTEPRPRDETARINRVEAMLDHLDAVLVQHPSIELTRAETALATATAIDAVAVGWHPLIARAWRVDAAVLRELGDGKQARSSLVAAAAAATAAGDLDELARLDLALADVEARLTSDFGRGDDWLALADGTLGRLGGHAEAQVQLARERGLLADRAGHLRTAEASYRNAVTLVHASGDRAALADTLGELAVVESERDELDQAGSDLAAAIPLARASYGGNHPRVATLLHDAGVVEYRAGRYAASFESFSRALAIRAAAFGTDSVEYAKTLQALGNAELALDRVDISIEHVDEAIAILVARLGPDHPDVADAYNDVGGAYHKAGMFERARQNAEKTLAAREHALGPDHPDVGQSLVNLAIESKALGRWDIVEPSYVRALAIFDKAYGERNTTTAIVHLNFAEALRVEGKLDRAATEYAIAQATIVALLGADHPILAHIWNGEGQLALARGDQAVARPLLERAAAMREQAGDDATALAETRFALARALDRADPRATTLATQARDAYRSAGRGFAAQVTAIDAWLAKR